MATLSLLAMAIYFWMQPTPDYATVRFLLILLVLTPIALGACYLIRRFIEGLAD